MLQYLMSHIAKKKQKTFYITKNSKRSSKFCNEPGLDAIFLVRTSDQFKIHSHESNINFIYI